MRPDMDAQQAHFFLVAAQNRPWQTKVRNAITHHAADMAFALKDGHIITHLCHLHRHHQPRRAAADYRDPLSLGRLFFQLQFLKETIGYIVLNAGNLHRTALAPLNAMAFTLFFMVTDQRTNYAHGIVGK